MGEHNNVTIENCNKIINKYILKKYGSLDTPRAILDRRTLVTATVVLDEVKGVDFGDLSLEVYMLFKDINFKEIARRYEAQIELASTNADKFMYGLDKFYTNMANYIKKNKLIKDYLDFVTLCFKIYNKRFSNSDIKGVLNCYIDLIMQSMYYVSENKFDLKHEICGLKLDGTIMYRDAYIWNMDIIINDVISKASENSSAAENILKDNFSKVGVTINSYEDLEELNRIDRIRSHQLQAMIAYINEYTYDILPVKDFNSNIVIFLNIIIMHSKESLLEELDNRINTLSTNGAKVVFNIEEIKEVYMKEVFYDNRVVLLYRISTVNGDISGYYDTVDKYLFNILVSGCTYDDDIDYRARRNIEMLILSCYSFFVAKNGDLLMNNFHNIAFYRSKKSEIFGIEPSIFRHGGKIKNTYDKSEKRVYNRVNDYDEKEVTINGYIRNLPLGQTASEEAIRISRELGYDLPAGKTYVRPFIKHVIKIKEK